MAETQGVKIEIQLADARAAQSMVNQLLKQHSLSGSGDSGHIRVQPFTQEGYDTLQAESRQSGWVNQQVELLQPTS